MLRAEFKILRRYELFIFLIFDLLTREKFFCIKIMKQVTLDIPDNKYQFFMELIQSLDFVQLDEIDIPEEHKSLVRERIRSAKPEDFISWEVARKKLVKK